MSGINLRKLILSLGGSGFFPQFPGTFGSLVSLIILWGLSRLIPSETIERAAFLGILFLFFFLLSLHFLSKKDKHEDHDASWIVIDEFLGMIISTVPFFFGNFSWWWWGTAFVLFRIFDMAKPFGIGAIDRKKTAISILLDDIVAGIYVLICLAFLSWIF